jgi:hypothetical protein
MGDAEFKNKRAMQFLFFCAELFATAESRNARPYV